MLKHEVAKELTCEQYGAFIKTAVPVAHALPDGRMLLWYNERDVHEFMVAWNSTHPEVKDESKSEAVSVHACFSVTNHEDSVGRTGSEDSGTQQGPGNTEEIPSGGEVQDPGL